MRINALLSALLSIGLLGSALTANAQTSSGYATKTLYQPQQARHTYEAPPKGFHAIYTELLARHGARGLTSLSDDAALYNLWRQAQTERALTPLGQTLGPAIEELMQANIRIGYGNLTALGKQEHQALAQRLWQRLQPMFEHALSQQQPRPILWVSSGVGRAVDSKDNFIASLAKQDARLPKIIQATAKVPDASGTEVGINRYQLYFHALKPSDAQVAPQSASALTYELSRQHQTFLKHNSVLQQAMAQAEQNSARQKAARSSLRKLFHTDFITRLEQGHYQISDAGTFHGTDANGQAVTLTGTGKTTINNAVEAMNSLYALYAIAPAFETSLRNDWRRFISPATANQWAELADTEDFYEKGPSFIDQPHQNQLMARELLNDFFNEIDGLSQTDTAHLAKLRFSHAEIVIPFAYTLGLTQNGDAMPVGTPYRYSNNAWRGERISPFAANIQWDVFRNEQGQLLVKMLYNERETLFKPTCDFARVNGTRYFYDYQSLKQCYRAE